MGSDSYSPQSQLMHCSKQSRIDGRRLPAMRDQRLVGQADDQQAGLTVASRYQSRHAFWTECACFAHCQNVSAAGLSGPLRAARPMSIVFGSGISRKSFIRPPKTYAKRSAAEAATAPALDHGHITI